MNYMSVYSVAAEATSRVESSQAKLTNCVKVVPRAATRFFNGYQFNGDNTPNGDVR